MFKDHDLQEDGTGGWELDDFKKLIVLIGVRYQMSGKINNEHEGKTRARPRAKSSDRRQE